MTPNKACSVVPPIGTAKSAITEIIAQLRAHPPAPSPVDDTVTLYVGPGSSQLTPKQADLVAAYQYCRYHLSDGVTWAVVLPSSRLPEIQAAGSSNPSHP